jgi:phytoene dehydrogenase-like protein
MAHYTLVRNGKVAGTKALTDAMAARLEARGVELIPVAEPVRAAWVPGRSSRQVRLAQERATFAEVIAGGRRG